MAVLHSCSGFVPPSHPFPSGKKKRRNTGYPQNKTCPLSNNDGRGQEYVRKTTGLLKRCLHDCWPKTYSLLSWSVGKAQDTLLGTTTTRTGAGLQSDISELSYYQFQSQSWQVGAFAIPIDAVAVSFDQSQPPVLHSNWILRLVDEVILLSKKQTLWVSKVPLSESITTGHVFYFLQGL